MKSPVIRTDINSNDLRWYLYYTKPRAEKVAYNSLLENQHEVFLPLIEQWKTWNNRQRKLISTPIFPGYIFIRSSIREMSKFLLEDKIVCFIKTGNTPAYLRDEDISLINEMTANFSDLAVQPRVCIGQKVRVIRGDLAGYEGIVVKIKGRYRFGINISGLDQFVSVEVDARDLEFIN